MPKNQELIQPRIDTYLKSTWYTRWIIIGVVSASIWFVPNVHRSFIAPLLVAAVGYQLILYYGGKRNSKLLTNREIMLMVDGYMALILIAYSGYTSSPYLFLLAFMIISASFWYGSRAIILVAILQSSALIALELVQGKTPVAKNLLIETIIVMTIGLYVSWLTKFERLERNQLLKIGSETERERQRLSALINSVRDTVLVLDNKDHIAIHNQAATLLFGSKKEINGRPFKDMVHLLDEYDKPFELKIHHSSTPERKEIRVKAADNSIVNMEMSIAPYIVDRENRGNVIIMHDTSADKTIAQEREEFIAVASHELRTPLAIAESDVSMLLSPSYLPENKESVSMLNGALRSLTQLSHIISDLTNLSQIEDEKFDIELDPLNPAAILEEFYSDYVDQAKSKGIHLVVDIDEKVEAPSILTSRYVVQEILTIFLNNAIKFTDKGKITLSLAPTKEKGGVTFSVQDTGIGISQSDQKNIFEKFFQSEHYTSRVHGGTGLGLYIAKRLANRITAKMWFESELGKGSTFYLWVPPYSNDSKDRMKVASAEIKDFFNTV
jgi:PAS domain S-box-containing protein